MRAETYTIRAKSSAMTFEFISEGPKGMIKKRVQYHKIYEDAELYNLAFGDINLKKKIDDKVVSNNADRDKVLATVAATLFVFMKKYPNAIVYAKGSNLARTRLYQIGISQNLEDITKQFEVLGELDEDEIEVFQKNKNYLAFYIRNK
jgi:DNA-binding transcriptional regulator WhiA